ncbi:MAG: hypothetical protein M3493_11790 [Actinomycetota bacterium]|jgi:hypothetical protein|nr:hypothetical protein [Euzebyaceae bacterium]MDQ3453357.1 hypothetical protein [Actinomycetota bacterium]
MSAFPDVSGRAFFDGGYLDVNLTYGLRGVALSAGVMKQSTGSLRSGWHVYVGGGLGSAGPSVSLTVSPNAVSSGWNAAVSHSSGATMYQFGLDAAGKPFTEAGAGGPRSTALIAYHAWPVREL